MIRTNAAAKFILVGNINDLEFERQVATKEGYSQALAWGCQYYEASAKTGHNIDEMFIDLVRKLRGDDTKQEIGSHAKRTDKSTKKSRKRCIVA
jgi:GTPase SAR1 family protein